MTLESGPRFNTRTFVTLIAAISFAPLPIAGTCLHFVSHSPSARATVWGLSQHAWMSIHNVLALLFVVAIGGHLAYNWRPLLRYLRVTSRGSRVFPSELVAAAAAVVLPVILVTAHTWLVD